MSYFTLAFSKKEPTMSIDYSSASTMAPPTSSDIATRAHEIWEAQGRPEGHELEHWLKAEEQPRNEKRAEYPRSRESAVRMGTAKTAL
jgi:hypothetical protein